MSKLTAEEREENLVPLMETGWAMVDGRDAKPSRSLWPLMMSVG